MQELTPHKKSFREFVLPLALVLGCIYLLSLAKAAVFPFILSAALAYVLNPIISYFEMRGIKRFYAIAGLYLTFGLLVSVVIYLLLHFLSFEIATFQQSWPSYADKLQLMMFNLNAKLVKNYPFMASMKITDNITHVLGAMPVFILSLLPALTLLFIVPFLTFFILLGGSTIIDYLLDHIPARHAEIVLHIASRIDASLGNYLRGVLTEAFIIFLIAFTGLVILDLNYSAFIAILIGISSLIPYAGALLGAVVSSVVAYFQFGTLMPIIKILIFFTGIRFFDDWVLQPYIMRKAVKLNPAVVLFALMAGWEIGGIWGIIFSIPLTCIIKEVVLIAIELQETEFRWKPKSEPTRISIPYT